jgi:hypothetical protein
MAGREDDIELLKKLMEAGQFPAKTPTLSARGAASVALAFMCGVPITALVRLTRADWRPEGRDLVAIAPEGEHGPRRAAKARLTPVLGTPMAVVERCLALVGPGGPDTPLLQSANGGACVFNAVDSCFDKATRRMGRPALRLGRVRALFVSLVEEADDRHDGTAEYVAGQDRMARAPVGYSLENPPPEGAMRALLERAFPFHAPWRLLTHAGGGRGPKIAKLPPRANARRGIL